MKSLLFVLCFLLAGGLLQAQQMITVTTGKTVSLRFPAPVAHVDLGNNQIDARLVGPTGRVVLVKALVADMMPTNLTVVTTGDEVYTFGVRYGVEPERDQVVVMPVALSPVNYASQILDNSRCATGMSAHAAGIYAQVQGIYVRDSLLFFHLKIANSTSLDYNIEAIRFLLADKPTGRRMAIQERSLSPLDYQGNHTQVPHGGNTSFVAVLPKIGIAGKRRIVIELIEQEGSRNLRMRIKPGKLARANVLPLP